MPRLPTDGDDVIMLDARGAPPVLDALGGQDVLRLLTAPGQVVSDSFFAGLSHFERLLVGPVPGLPGPRASGVILGPDAAAAFGLAGNGGEIAGSLRVAGDATAALSFHLSAAALAASSGLRLTVSGACWRMTSRPATARTCWLGAVGMTRSKVSAATTGW
ncbi:hypothetical protein ACE7GA_25365 [Roseomonas sp. CCTCC AB2023176]|uniref:hypothetical protein n=1 Tax=Roseomonas sp. CCTCC AB2023176 TaxID=3342640 RepID=UPI0035DF658C